MSNNKRLHVVVRADLDPGLGSAQMCHATDEFRKKYPWADTGDTMICLEARDQIHLLNLALFAALDGITEVMPFYEPDLNGECTAVAFGSAAKKMLADLPKAFDEDVLLARLMAKAARKTAGRTDFAGSGQHDITDEFGNVAVTLDENFLLKKVAADIRNPNGLLNKTLQQNFDVPRARL